MTVNQTRTESMAVMSYTLPSAAPFRSHCKCDCDVSYWSLPPPWWWKIRVRNVKKENRPHVSFAKSPPSTSLARTDQSYLWPPTIVRGRLMCNVRTRTYILYVQAYYLHNNAEWLLPSSPTLWTIYIYMCVCIKIIIIYLYYTYVLSNYIYK